MIRVEHYDEGDEIEVRFGHNTVRISRGYLKGEDPENVRAVALSEFSDPRPARELSADDTFIGRMSSEIPGTKIKIIFDNLKGLDALLDELVLLRK